MTVTSVTFSLFSLLSAHGQHAPAMKFYLESGVVATDFFTETHVNLVYDEQVRDLADYR